MAPTSLPSSDQRLLKGTHLNSPHESFSVHLLRYASPMDMPTETKPTSRTLSNREGNGAKASAPRAGRPLSFAPTKDPDTPLPTKLLATYPVPSAPKPRDFGLGPVHDVPLAEARTLAAEIGRMVRAGRDPVKKRGVQRKATPTCETVARHCYEAMRGGWNHRWHASWISSFENQVFASMIGAERVQ
jgi:hypothetical protein